MHFSMLAPLLAAALPIASAHPVTASALNCREGPGTDYDVVKVYYKGNDIDIVCQAAGENIKGDKLWDKTKDGCYVTDYYVRTGTSSYVTDKCDDDGKKGGGGDKGDKDKPKSKDKLPGLDSTQSAHAKEIIAQAKKDEVGRQGCLAGIATALVESHIYIYANENVKESFNYPHDKVGSDHDSVGIFQQRVRFYPDIEADMDPAKSAHQFYKKMITIDGWKSMPVGELCQAVQVSAYPDRYAEQVGNAKKICDAGGF